MPDLDALTQVLLDISLDVFLCLGSRLELMCPRATWVEHVPPRYLSLMPSAARVVIAKAVNDRVPHGNEATDEQTLSQRNPDRFCDQPSSVKVVDVEVGCGLHAVGVLAQAQTESASGSCDGCSLSCPCRNRLADIDRHGELPVSVYLSEERVRGEVAGLVDRVDPRAREAAQFSHGRWLRVEHRVGDAQSEVVHV